MAKIKSFVYRGNSRKKRKDVHSKNASKGQMVTRKNTKVREDKNIRYALLRM
jgi:hypothetical protein